MELAVTPGYRYRDRVPNQPKTPSRSVRVDDGDWDELGRIATQRGTVRGKVINELIGWFLGKPGAELPARPADRAQEPGRTVRIDAEVWERLPADPVDPYTSRANLINEVLAWYLRMPDAALPERPQPNDKQA
ncbi:hypothetical protein N5079_19960 [Planotetraspora sp. A-T 1434]|uniref:hypothetical protein n=1 Tax=Planotetraspora sp. A-T 1434 TaxID=2979219 RepID=UPI0021BEE7E0|nr:hypothetical protein [Planotetraspora sp. A-T 1434]MCT9932481.1 hypothetical protein [Planotetraspora sp. A-T 1434]